MSLEKYHEGKPDIEKAVKRGWQYLESKHENGYFPSYISTTRDMMRSQISPREVFSTVVIADTILKNQPENETTRAALQYIEKQRRRGQFTFFEDRTKYPPDTDTNALGYSVLLETRRIPEQDAHKILDAILNYRDDNGLVQVWLSKDRQNRIDPVVGANALYLAHLLNRGSDMVQTEQWLMETLNSGAYLTGSRYYHSPDAFLYVMGKLTKSMKRAETLKAKLAEHLKQRIGTTEYPLDLAMRVTTADLLVIDNAPEKRKLLKLQEQNGSWPADALFQYGDKRGYFGGKAVTTAFSIKSLASASF